MKEKNFFEPPKCGDTKRMVRLMTRLINDYVENTPQARFALKTAMSLPFPLLQRQQKHSPYKQNINGLNSRMTYLERNEMNELKTEAMQIRERYKKESSTGRKSEEEAVRFGKLMKKG